MHVNNGSKPMFTLLLPPKTSILRILMKTMISFGCGGMHVNNDAKRGVHVRKTKKCVSLTFLVLS